MVSYGIEHLTVLLRGYITGMLLFMVNCVLKSLLSAFTHITYKGALSRGFCCFRSILC